MLEFAWVGTEWMALCVLGFFGFAAFVLLVIAPRRAQENRLAALEMEVRRLRSDVDNLKK